MVVHALGAGAAPQLSKLLDLRDPEWVAAYVFIDVALIVVLARIMAALFKRIRQPAVVGEIVAGILLGPSLLGLLHWHSRSLTDYLFPGAVALVWNGTSWAHATASSQHVETFAGQVRPALDVLAQVGLIVFMFIVGLELDAKLIRGRERVAAVISVSSIALPLGLGALLGWGLYHDYRGPGSGSIDAASAHGVHLPAFVLFVGAAMSVTAFPVLARILDERRMTRTRLGSVALACAAVDDILAWSLLALVLAIVGGDGVGSVVRIIAESLLFVAFMFVAIRPLLARWLSRWYERAGDLTPNILSIVVVGFFASAWVTSKIGIHAIFGAFLFGVIMPREGTAALFRQILERLEQVSVLILLPVFFVITGLSVDVTKLTAKDAVVLPLILVVACIGKFVGASTAARLQGLSARQSSGIGILMNTRGLTELVILNLGFSAGVLSRSLFTMLIVMAVLTTAMTEPILRLIYSDAAVARERAEAEREALGTDVALRVLVVLNDDDREPLTRVATVIASSELRSEIVLSHVRPAQRRRLELGSGTMVDLAQMTETLAQLNGYAADVRAAGIACVVRAHSSDDIAADVASQATTVQADIVLLPARADPGLIGLVSRSRQWQWLVLDADGAAGNWLGRAAVINADARTDSSGTVAEIAARAAVGTGASLIVATTTKTRARVARLADALGLLRVPCTVSSDHAASASLTVELLPAGFDALPAAPAPTLYVVPAEGESEDHLESLAERWRDRVPTQPEPQPAP